MCSQSKGMGSVDSASMGRLKYLKGRSLDRTGCPSRDTFAILTWQAPGRPAPISTEPLPF
jgi:hypothetical protein